MTRTPQPTDGVLLGISEFYYLLRTNHATRVVGLEAEGLFPPPGPAGDRLIAEGFAQLQLHGWLRPAAQRGRFELNPEVALLVAVVADAQIVLVSARTLPETRRATVNHYIGADLIVELTLTPQRQVRLAFVQNKPVLLQRIEDLLAPTHNPLPPARYSLLEPEFDALAAVARAGQTAQAVDRLVAAGLTRPHAVSLVQALQEPVGDGSLFVMRVSLGEILYGRKGTLYEGSAGAWLTRREDSTSLALSIETVQAGTVSGVVDSYLQSLMVPLEPVA